MESLFTNPYESALQFSQALDIAVKNGFMSRDHGAVLWKHFLKVAGIDVPKQTSDVPAYYNLTK